MSVFCFAWCHVVYSLFFFFFFKQKTAYEMRISDWSSDVCSSDLADGDRQAWPDDRAHPAQHLALAVVDVLGHHGPVQVEVEPVEILQPGEILEDLADDALVGILGDLRRGRGIAPRQRQQGDRKSVV